MSRLIVIVISGLLVGVFRPVSLSPLMPVPFVSEVGVENGRFVATLSEYYRVRSVGRPMVSEDGITWVFGGDAFYPAAERLFNTPEAQDKLCLQDAPEVCL